MLLMRIFRTFISLVVSLFLLSCSDFEHAVQEAVDRQMTLCPQSRLGDLYKSFFQDKFGPGHLLRDAEDVREKMRQYLVSECAIAAGQKNMLPEWEPTGYEGRFVRVNLSVINSGKVPLEDFLDAFLESAGCFSLPDVNEWSKEWHHIESVIRVRCPSLPGLEDDSARIDEVLRAGKYAFHHSAEYNAAYNPHYRLMERSLFERKILPRL